MRGDARWVHGGPVDKLVEASEGYDALVVGPRALALYPAVIRSPRQ